jgi:hypothetical protein
MGLPSNTYHYPYGYSSTLARFYSSMTADIAAIATGVGTDMEWDSNFEDTSNGDITCVTPFTTITLLRSGVYSIAARVIVDFNTPGDGLTCPVSLIITRPGLSGIVYLDDIGIPAPDDRVVSLSGSLYCPAGSTIVVAADATCTAGTWDLIASGSVITVQQEN